MFSPEVYTNRRKALRREMSECNGVVLIVGNEPSPNCCPSIQYYFRQDSSFRYLFGLEHPSLWGVIDLDSGEELLFGEEQTLDDIIWSGTRSTLAEDAATVGITEVGSPEDLYKLIAEAQRLERRVHTLPPYRGETKLSLAKLFDATESPSAELIFAMAKLRERKGAEEIADLEASYAIGYKMHTMAMQMCRPGVVEREIGGRLEGIARSLGAGVSFPPICSQHGETLHNIGREGILQSGRLFLCDAGGETLEGYCSDHTRTYPIASKFTDIQRDLYNVVLQAHDHVAQVARPNMPYSDLQHACYMTLADGLKSVGLVSGSAEDIVASGAMSLFMPHGVSHGIGLDVHDCEAFGERSFDPETYAKLIDSSMGYSTTSCIVRSQWILEEGTVLSDEPGIYFIPALIEKRRSDGLYQGIVNYDRLTELYDFGGIRVEDDLVITDTAARQIGSTYERQIPITVEQIEEFIKEHRQ